VLANLAICRFERSLATVEVHAAPRQLTGPDQAAQALRLRRPNDPLDQRPGQPLDGGGACPTGKNASESVVNAALKDLPAAVATLRCDRPTTDLHICVLTATQNQRQRPNRPPQHRGAFANDYPTT
jgi:hypothetical protein